MYQHYPTYHQILVLGAGESGTGAALLAQKHGMNVLVSDTGHIKPTYKELLATHQIPYEESGHTITAVQQADLIVVSPGIPAHAKVFSMVRPETPIISEIEFASWFTNAHITAVTGSNGKTTTALLTGHIMRQAGLDVCVAGNVGNSFAAELTNTDHEYFVLELSSFQLDRIQTFKPHIAILTNITPDHLDHYNNDFQAYADSKMRITLNQGKQDALIYCADDAVIDNQLKKATVAAKTYPFTINNSLPGEGAYIHQNELHINISNTHFSMTIEELALQGKHNLYNSLAAGMAARLIDIRKESLKASLSNYQNVEHRLEYVANVHGVAYYNDSKATNVNATWYALESFDGPIVWIAGGQDKGNDYTMLLPLVRQKVKAIVCLGKDNRSIHEAFSNIVPTIVDTISADQAVLAASLLAKKNDIVLLSPACASFDLFENFEERGNLFKAAVRSL